MPRSVSAFAETAVEAGRICGAEHNLVVHASVHARLMAALERLGAAVLSAAEAAAFSGGRLQLDGGWLDPRMVGQTASNIAATLGIERPYPIKLIAAPVVPEHLTNGSPLMREKLMPILSLMTVQDDDEALAVCRQVLEIEGLGHTAIIHTVSRVLAERFGVEMPAGRILVNSPGVQGISGVTTGLVPSFTLGCGTFGGNSTTDNVSFTNLFNIKRLAYALDGRLDRSLPLWTAPRGAGHTRDVAESISADVVCARDLPIGGFVSHGLCVAGEVVAAEGAHKVRSNWHSLLLRYDDDCDRCRSRLDWARSSSVPARIEQFNLRPVPAS